MTHDGNNDLMRGVGRGIRVVGWILVALAIGFFVATLIADVPYGIAVLVLVGVVGLALVDVGKFLIRRADRR